jgi:pyruvate dehydrogenase E2 component (dihydrolipoamide acetyltransferase)
MAIEVKMPKLGLTMVDGKVVEWRKHEGETVEKGEILLVIETEKITYEYESPGSGILGKIVIPEGETVLVGSLLAYITQPGEKLLDLSQAGTAALKSTMLFAAVPSSASQPDKSTVNGATESRIKVSPVARKIAEEHCIDITGIAGSGPEGRIVKEDVYKAIEKAKDKPAGENWGQDAASTGRITLKPLSTMRRTIARRMSQSFQTIPHFWVEARADVTRLKELRDQILPSIEAKTGLRITYTDLFIKIVARTLEDFPDVNSRWTERGIELLEDINIGIATGVSDGLIVPVIHNANKKSLAELTLIRADLVKRGRAGKLGLDELTGSTYTITNLGTSPGITRGNPIINPPEVAILGIAAISEQPAVVAGQVVPRLSMTMIMAIDHRVLDGVITAEFLGRLIELIENPFLLI